MTDNKFLHFALKTGDGFLAKDIRTNQLLIYEDEDSAKKFDYGCEVVGCYIYSEKEYEELNNRVKMLEQELGVAIEIIEDCGVDYDEIAEIKRGDKL